MRFFTNTAWTVLSLMLLSLHASAALLGIDFGTEFTKAVLIAPNVPFDILLTSESKRKDISGLALSFDNTDPENVQIQRHFGTHALSTCLKNPRACMLYPKMLLGVGSRAQVVDEYLSKFNGVPLGLQTQRDAVVIMASTFTDTYSDTFLIEEVAAMIMLDIKNRANTYWKERSPETADEVTEAVISVPRFFNEAARVAITDAAELAGLKVVALVDDGLAIALDYAQKKADDDFKLNETEYHLIFDMGAGSTKLSLFSFTNNAGKIDIELENYAHSQEFNGQVFTKTVRNHLLTQFMTTNGLDLDTIANDSKAMHKLWQASEKAKLILSANTETNVSIESLHADIDFKGHITRDELEERLRQSVVAIDMLLQSVFRNHEEKKLNLKSVILAGGATRAPLVQETINKYFDNPELISKNVNADESVVFGTTLRGAQLRKLIKHEKLNVIDKPSASHTLKYHDESGNSGQIDVAGSDLTSGEKRVANITEFDSQFVDKFTLDIFQDNEFMTHSYNLSMPHRVNSTTCESPRYEITYGLTRHNVFIIHNVKVYCTSEGKTPKGTTMLSHTKVYGYEPMPSTMKKNSIRRLVNLEMQEQQRAVLAESKNTLEALLYELRYIVEELEANVNGEAVDEMNSVISTHLEWLDYDSDGATLTEVIERVEEVNLMKSKLEKWMKVSSRDLATANIIDEIEAFNNQKEEAAKKLAEIVANDEGLRKACDAFAVDFDKITEKLVYPTLDEVDTKIEGSRKYIDLVDKDEYNVARVEKLAEGLEAVDAVRAALEKVVADAEKVHDMKASVVRQRVLAAERTERAAKKSAEKEEAKTETTEESAEEIASDTPEHDEL